MLNLSHDIFPGRRTSTNRMLIVGLVVLHLVVLSAFSILTLPLYRAAHYLDVEIYFNDSLKLWNGLVPYRDFTLGYPPLALAAFSLPRVLTLGRSITLDDYAWLFVIENVVFSTLAILSILRILSRRRPANARMGSSLVVYVLGATILAPVLLWRYDMFVALLTIAAMLCILRSRPTLAGIFLGLGVSAKLYPIILLLIFGINCIASRDRRALLRLAAGGMIGMAIALLPITLIYPEWLSVFLDQHVQRGVQVESVASGLILFANTLGITNVGLTSSYGACHLASPVADAVVGWMPFISIISIGIVLICCLFRFRHERATFGEITRESLTAYVAIGLLAFIVTNKVFSPQYLIWLLPFVPFLRLRFNILLLLICTLTILIYPICYDLLLAFDPVAVIALNLRNALVVALLLWLLKDYQPIFRSA